MSDKLKEIMSKQNKKHDEKVGHSDDVVQLVGFIIGDEEYAVPILAIQEIIKPFPWTRVPQVPKYVVGVFNMRGAVIPLIDLRLKFGLSPKKHGEETRFIVMRHGDDVAGFVIYTKPSDLARISGIIKEKRFSITQASLIRKPLISMPIDDPEKKERVNNFLQKLEDLDDVQKVYSNLV